MYTFYAHCIGIVCLTLNETELGDLSLSLIFSEP